MTIGEKGAILYDGEPTGATLPQVTIPGMTITEIKDAAGTVIGYTIKYGDNEPVNLKLISEKPARFGIHTMTFTIRELKLWLPILSTTRL